MRVTMVKLEKGMELPLGGFEYKIPLNMYACAIAVNDFERDVHWEEGRHIVIPYMYGNGFLENYVERDEGGDITLYSNDGSRMYALYNCSIFDYYRQIEKLSPRITSLEFKDVCYVGSTLSHRYYVNSEYYDDALASRKLNIQPFLHEVVVRTPVRNVWLDNEISKTLAYGSGGNATYVVLDRMVRETEEILMSRII